MNPRILILIGAVYVSLLIALLRTFSQFETYIDTLLFVINLTVSIIALWEFVKKRNT